ncbi:MAG: thiamine phosphate synthase [SAR202 cluster bacterium]|nr:thiamine phosphate synthase [SAR202 cluster bacterium]
MTGTKGDSQYRYQLVFKCLKELSQFVPAADWPVPALQDLREFLPEVSAPSALVETHDGPPTTSSDALALVTFAQSSLYLLNDSLLDGVWGGEAMARITHIVEELTAQLASVARREKADLVRGLYVIIDPLVTGGRDPLDVAKAAVRGGARMLQLRDKQRDKGDSLPLARSLQKLCQTSGTLLIINDHADVAAIVGSAGLHVGQTDLPVTEARKVLAHRQVLGRSNHEIGELVESERMGSDHVAFGPIYHTGTKDVGHSPQGIGKLRIARETAKTPLVAIGGINAENAAAVIEAGADAICVTAAVGSAADPEAAAAKLVRVIEDAGGRI